MTFKRGDEVRFAYGDDILHGRVIGIVGDRYRVNVDGEIFSVDPEVNGMEREVQR